MRWSIPAFGVLAVLGVLASSASAQRGFGPPGGGAPGGGGPGGGFGGGGMRMGGDSGQIFDFLSKGRPYFLISDTRSMREPLSKWAKDKGITNDQVTREQFNEFFKTYSQTRTDGGGPSGGPPSNGGGPFGGPGGFGKGGPGGFMGKGGPGDSAAPGSPAAPGAAPAQNPIEALNAWADSDFKRRDRNNDGQLNRDEMSDRLKEQAEGWDANKDGLISLEEYRGYFAARMQQGDSNSNSNSTPNASPPSSNPLTILIEEDYDRRPTMIRAGKLPKELPKWFGELDTDQDGQVSLPEWRKGGRDIDEFPQWDRNEDGLMTAEEVLFKMKAPAVASNSDGSSASQTFGGFFGRKGGSNGADQKGGGGRFGGFGPGGFTPGGGPSASGGFGPGGFSPGNFGKKRDR